MSRKKRRVSKETIRRLSDILKEFLIGNLESEFPVEAPPTGPADAAEPDAEIERPPAESGRVAELGHEDVDEEPFDDEDEAEQYDETKFYFDLADVEYCVDVTITEIVREKLVAGYGDPQKPPTLSEIFQVLFGEEDPLTKQVQEFEELISGYDDHVHIDNLRQAHNEMSEIIEELEDRSQN
jgi:hypothetical protein